MSDILKNKLLSYEDTPPPSVWQKISGRLDNECRVEDMTLAAKLSETAVDPPSSLWNAISHSLDSNEQPETKIPASKVIPIRYRRIAAAAVIVGLLAAATLYFLPENEQQKFTAPAATLTKPSQSNAAAGPARSQPRQSFVPERTDSAHAAARSSGTAAPQKRKPVASSASESPANLGQTTINIEEETKELRPVQTLAAVQPQVAVPSPPIRDESGRIIMDVSVISNPGEPYIVITSPNGNQTKISNKFLSCLSYLNMDVASSDINYEGRQWKNRFQEWRNRLLSEAAFIPAANNFFDIFEMQELIEDNR